MVLRFVAAVSLLLAAVMSPFGNNNAAYASALQASYYTWPSFPTGTIGVVQPSIHKRFSFQGMQIANEKMWINGKKVPVAWNQNTSEMSYIPHTPLSAGTYHVKLSVSFILYEPVSFHWSFSVAADAVNTLPAVSNNEQKALRAINDYRRVLGLPNLKWKDALNASASAHAQYLQQNNVMSHTELPGKKDFIGKTLTERTGYFGLDASGFAEDISEQSRVTPQQVVDSLFNAPYHRIPFIDPRVTEVGYGEAGMYHVLDFEMQDSSDKEQWIAYPAPDQSGIPARWTGHEIPDPLRLHKNSEYPVGYPIMAGVYGRDIQQVSIVSARLSPRTVSGKSVQKSVPLLKNSAGLVPADHELSNEVILIPQHPLQQGTTYQVHLALRISRQDGSSYPIVKNWSFTVASAEAETKELHHALKDPSNLTEASRAPQHKAAFGLDQDVFTLDGMTYPMTAVPMLINNHSYLSVRDLATALHAQVTWDSFHQAAVYTTPHRTVVLFTGKPVYALNGTNHSTTMPAKLMIMKNGEARTMIPVRLLSTLLGCDVKYDSRTQIITITYPK